MRRATQVVPVGVDGLSSLVEAGDGERFAGVFRSTWARLPAHVRTRLLRYWRRPRRTRSPSAFPMIRLLPPPLYRPAAPLVATSLQDELRFSAPVLDSLPVRLARTIIAHEIAHQFQAACGGSDASSGVAEEREVAWLVGGWGFCAEAEVREWLGERVECWSNGGPVWRKR